MLEGYTTLGDAAASPSSIELGTLVTGPTYRHPGILVKHVTTLDVLSAAGPGWASAPRGTRRSTAGSGCPTRRPASGSACSRTPCAWRTGCSPARQPVRGGVDQPRAAAEPPAAGAAASDHGRRRRRAAHPEARGAVRRRVQPVRPGLGPEGIPHKLDVIRAALRRRRARLRRDLEDLPDPAHHGHRRRAARRGHRALGRAGGRAALAACARPASTTSSSRWRTPPTRRPTRWSRRSSARSPEPGAPSGRSAHNLHRSSTRCSRPWSLAFDP